MVNGRTVAEDMEREYQRQSLRDHFAAAALTGLLENYEQCKQSIFERAYNMADAMLRERERTFDAKPRELSDDQRTLRNAADLLGPGGFKNLANELLSLSRRLADKSYAKSCKKCNISHTERDADDRPEPIKDGDCDRSQPINGPDPDSRVWETPVHTPQPHATPPQGSVQGEGSVRDSRTENEPVAWVAWFDDEDKPDADFLFSTKERADDWCCKRGADPVPLYRHPPCQDFSQKNLTLTDAEREAVRTAAGCMGMWMLENGVTEDESMRRSAATLRGLLERLGGVR